MSLFKGTKFHYRTPAEAVALQKAMFTLGFCWVSKEKYAVRKVMDYLDYSGFIFVDQDCRMEHSSEGYGLGETRHKAAFATVLFEAAAKHKAAKVRERKESRKRAKLRKGGFTAFTPTATSVKPADAVGLVEIKRRDGQILRMDNDCFTWTTIPIYEPFEIVAYRVIEKPKVVSFVDMVADITQGASVVGCVAQEVDPTLDPSANPKHAIGNTSLPMTMPSALFRAMVALGKQNGAGKYGGANYIGTPVVMSTYMNAIQRHFDKILMGEDCDEVDGVPHWGAIGANIDIIVSAAAAGTLIDDRLRADGQLEAYKALTPLVKSLAELHKDRTPKHFYMKDKP
jgi:hypothetical protein